MKLFDAIANALAALAVALVRGARRSRRRPSRCRSSTRSPSAGRSPRSSTATPPTSRRRIPASSCKPIYSGSYQESITKALTAVKSGEPPVTSILLSTDMYTLIDEDAIVPFDDLIKTAEDRRGSRASTRRSWRTARPAARPGAFRSSARRSCCTTTRRCSRKRGSIPTGRRRTWKEMARVRAEAHQARRVGQGHAVGRADSVVGLPVLAVPGARDRERRQPDERRRHRGLLRQARGDRRAAVLGRPRQQVQGASAKASSSGARRRRISSREGRDDVDDDRQPHQRQEQRQVRLRRRDAAGGQAARQPDRRRQLLHLQEVDAGAARGGVQVHQVGDHARSAPRSGASTPATSRCAPTRGRRR